MEVLKKLKIELPYDPVFSLLGIYPENNMIQKDTCTPRFTAALFTILDREAWCAVIHEVAKSQT